MCVFVGSRLIFTLIWYCQGVFLLAKQARVDCVWNNQNPVTCCEWRRLPGGHGGSVEGFDYRLPPLGEDGGRGCFGITHGCITKTEH